MPTELTCPDCDEPIQSADQLEKGHEVTELEIEDEGVALYGNRDLFLCKKCKRPLGVGT